MHVTIHPTVILCKEEGYLVHKSVVYISDELGQNASAVYAIMKTLVAFIKQLLPEDSTWNYFYSGHGEGLCDGIHDRPKRMSNDAVKERKYSIKNAFDFYV